MSTAPADVHQPEHDTVRVPSAPQRRRADPAIRPPWHTRPWLLPAGFGLFAMLLSLAGSWIPSLWEDETASLLSATRPLGSLFMMLGHIDAVHGSYYLALHAWIDLVGSSPFALRFPSAVAIGWCVAAVVVLVRRLGSTRGAAIAGLVCAVLPRLTYAGSEARSYAFSAAIAAWLTVILIELLRVRGERRMLWVGYAVLVAAGVYCFLYVGLMLTAHAAILACSRPGRRFTRAWLMSAAAGLVAALPVAVWAFLQRGQVAYLAGHAQVTPDAILVHTWFGYSAAAVLAWLLILIAIAGAVSGAVSGALRAGLAELRRDPAARPTPPRTTASLPAPELVAAVWLVVPSVLLLGSSAAVADFTPRYLTMCAPAAGILIACGILRLARLRRLREHGRAVVIGATALVLAAMIPAFLVQRGPYAQNNSDWKEVSALVGAHASPGDAVLFDQSAPRSQRPQLAMRSYPAGFVGLRDPLLKRAYVDNTDWDDTMYSLPQAVDLGRMSGVTRVWLVEYATPSHMDQWGLRELATLGFTHAAHYRAFRAEVIELTRRPADLQTRRSADLQTG